MRIYLIILFFVIYINTISSQNCNSLLTYDRIETYTWAGLWNSLTNAGYYTNVSVSSNTSAALIGVGNGSSVMEQSTYVLPVINVNPNHSHIFKFRLGSYRITSTGTTSGVDAPDYVDVRLSTNNGTTYVTEMRITGFSNAFWNYNTNATASKVANGSLQTYAPTAGGNRTNTGDGYSVIELTIPAGVSNIAVNLFCRANSAGEEWWIDDIELIQSITRPDNPTVTSPFSVDTTICYGEIINLSANTNVGTIEWFEQSSGGTAIATGNSFTTPMINQNTSYWIQSNNDGCLSGRSQTNITIEGCALPLELLSFYGEKNSNVVDLFWTTANEVNTAFFLIEKSYDGINWEEIGNVNAAGFYTETLTYSFTDESPKNGYNYYRLKQFDIDGSYVTYQVISVEIKKTTNVIIHQSEGLLWLKEVESFSNYKLMNIKGIIVYESQITSNNHSLETSYFTSGLYILVLMKSDGSFETTKVYIVN